jgi:hypothetical protein
MIMVTKELRKPHYLLQHTHLSTLGGLRIMFTASFLSVHGPIVIYLQPSPLSQLI